MRSDCNFVIGVSAAQPKSKCGGSGNRKKSSSVRGTVATEMRRILKEEPLHPFRARATLSIMRSTINKGLEQTGSLSSNTTKLKTAKRYCSIVHNA